MPRFLIVVFVIYVAIAIYGFQGFKTLFKNRWLQLGYGILFLSALLFFIIKLLKYIPGKALPSGMPVAGGIFFSFFLFALVLVFFLLAEDIIRFFSFIYTKIKGLTEGDAKYFPSRRKFVSIIGLGLAVLPFGALLYGMYKGKYNYKVLKIRVNF